VQQIKIFDFGQKNEKQMTHYMSSKSSSHSFMHEGQNCLFQAPFTLLTLGMNGGVKWGMKLEVDVK
jgi:hypothetical protein